MDCVFCGRGIEAGTGFIYVTPKGKALNFCSRKCEKNMLKLGRKPRKVKWTKTYREEKAIRMKSTPQTAKKETPKEKPPEKKKKPTKEKKKEK